MKKMNLSNLNSKNLEDLTSELKLHDIKIEFEDPKKFKEFSESIGKKYFFNYLSDLLKRNVTCILYEVDVSTKKIVACGAYIFSQYAIIYPEYTRFIQNHLNILRDMFGTFSILDVDGICLVGWKENKHFDDENLEGFGYFTPFIPPDSLNNLSPLDKEQFKQFCLSSRIDKRISEYFCELFDSDQELKFQPCYVSFLVNQILPAKYGFSYEVNEKLFDFLDKFYSNYDSLSLAKKILSKYFSERQCTIQFVAANEKSFAIEVGIQIYSKDTFEEFKRDPDIIEFCGENILEVDFPDFVSDIILKFKWNDENTKIVKIYFEITDKTKINKLCSV
jgi:hypothetical protein